MYESWPWLGKQIILYVYYNFMFYLIIYLCLCHTFYVSMSLLNDYFSTQSVFHAFDCGLRVKLMRGLTTSIRDTLIILNNHLI